MIQGHKNNFPVVIQFSNLNRCVFGKVSRNLRTRRQGQLVQLLHLRLLHQRAQQLQEHLLLPPKLLEPQQKQHGRALRRLKQMQLQVRLMQRALRRLQQIALPLRQIARLSLGYLLMLPLHLRLLLQLKRQTLVSSRGLLKLLKPQRRLRNLVLRRLKQMLLRARQMRRVLKQLPQPARLLPRTVLLNQGSQLMRQLVRRLLLQLGRPRPASLQLLRRLQK